MKTRRIALVVALLLLLVFGGCVSPKGDEPAPSVPTAANGGDPTAGAAEETPDGMPAPDASGQPAGTSEMPAESYDAEKTVYDLFEREDKSDVDVAALLAALPDLSWSRYDRYCRSVGGDAYELMDWLYGLTITDETGIVNLMKSTEGLDGAYSEGYSGVLANLATADPAKFVRCLAQTDDGDLSLLCGFTAYYMGYSGLEGERGELIAALEALLDGGILGDREQYACRGLLDALNKPLA